MKNIIELIQKYIALKEVISTYDKNPHAGIYFAKKYIGLSADITEKLDIAEKVPRLREESYKLIKDELLLYLDEVVKDISDGINKDIFIECIKDIYNVGFKSLNKKVEDMSILDKYFEEHNEMSKDDYIKYFNIFSQLKTITYSKLNLIKELIKQIDPLDNGETSTDILDMLFKLEKSYLKKYAPMVISENKDLENTLVNFYNGDKFEFFNDEYDTIYNKLVEYDGIKYDILLIETGFMLDYINTICENKENIIKAMSVRNDMIDIINA